MFAVVEATNAVVERSGVGAKAYVDTESNETASAKIEIFVIVLVVVAILLYVLCVSLSFHSVLDSGDSQK